MVSVVIVVMVLGIWDHPCLPHVIILNSSQENIKVVRDNGGQPVAELEDLSLQIPPNPLI